MSQFRGLLSATGLGSMQNLGVVAVDVTPNAVNWANITYNGTLGIYDGTERQITGINQTITLRVTNDASTDGVYYYVSNTSGSIITGGGDGVVNGLDPPSGGMDWLPHNGTFTVSNNQYVTFAASGNAFDCTHSVINTSDGNAVLDTFTYICINC